MLASRFIDETFDIHNGQQYILSIQCALDGFSFSVYDSQRNKFVGFAEQAIIASTAFELRNIINNIAASEPLFQHSYQQVKISYLTPETILVPEALYLPEESEALFNFSFDANRANELVVNQVQKSWFLLSAIPRLLKDWFMAKFPQSSFFSPPSPLFHYVSRHHPAGVQLLAYLHGHTLYALCTKDGQPELLNSFYVKTEADCLFYLLNIQKKVLSLNKTPLTLFGRILPGSDLENQLKRSFGTVQHAQAGKYYTLSYGFHQEPAYYHLPVLELALCE